MDNFEIEQLGTRSGKASVQNAESPKYLDLALGRERILWALDPFDGGYDGLHLWSKNSPPRFGEPSELDRQTALTLAHAYPQAEITPVYVVSQTVLSDLASDWGHFGEAVMNTKLTARRAFQEYLLQFDFLDLQKPRILLDRSGSKASCANRLLRFAQRTGAAAIALSTKERSSIRRLLSGSFSETLLAQADRPLLIQGTKACALSERPEVVIFPTDFSAACERSFKEVLKICKSFGAELHLYYNLEPWFDPNVQSGVQLLSGPWVAPDAAFLEAYAARERADFPFYSTPLDENASGFTEGAAALSSRKTRIQAQVCFGLAKDAGVVMQYIRENSRGSTAEAIVDYAKSLSARNSVLISMVTQTGPVSSWLLGSITRKVIRESSSPVYVLPRAPKH